MTISINMDTIGYDSKPFPSDIPSIINRLMENKVEIGIDEFAQLVGNYGYAFSPAVFDDMRRSWEGFDQIQVFSLDFDSGVTYQEVKRQAENIGIPITFAYHTYGASFMNERFRVVFVHDTPIKDPTIARSVYDILAMKFPGCDQSAANISKWFYGGKGLIEYNHKATFTRADLIFPHALLKFSDVNNQYF